MRSQWELIESEQMRLRAVQLASFGLDYETIALRLASMGPQPNAETIRKWIERLRERRLA